MEFTVETWAPDYGVSGPDGGLAGSDAHIELGVERAPEEWAPCDPRDASGQADSVLFIDGVQRIDARVWVTADSAAGGGAVLPQVGVCASWAAGAVRCEGRAQVVAAEVRRGVMSSADGLLPIVTRHGTYEPRVVAEGDGNDPAQEAIGRARGDLEARVAVEAAANSPVDLVVVDGPLGDRRHIPGAVGYVKAHHVTYLPPEQQGVVTQLRAGQRTPLFRIGDRRFRYSWYLRLPGPGSARAGESMALPHPGWGIVRCEAPGELPLAEAVVCADKVTAVLPRFATRPHQDARAPQNLHPIAGLERQLRRRLGDTALLERALRVAAASTRSE